MTTKLGTLEPVELRTAWEREDTEFTPWLAQDENIRLLGEALGLELEVQDQEVQVGPFRADILCRNTADNTLVLIENQLERTDHGHLGQLLTYAAGLDAVTVIWVASHFTEEHRAALDWLNRITNEGFYFFGLEIELWKIGDSLPAPKFNIIAKPNEWAKVAAEAKSGGGKLSPAQEAQVSFWAEFGRVIEETGSDWKVPKPQPSPWVGYGLGGKGFGLSPVVGIRDGRVDVRIWIAGPDATAYFHMLHNQREAIEQELGFTMSWHEKPDRKGLSIECRKEGDLSDPADRRRLIQWLLDTMDAIDRVFRPRIKTLDPADYVPAKGQDA